MKSTSRKFREIGFTKKVPHPVDMYIILTQIIFSLSFPCRNHDYENLALININRNPLGQNSKNLVSHWRTYSNMADGNHDESTAYEKRNYYDIYPLSKELKLQLYRSLTPLSTVSSIYSI